MSDQPNEKNVAMNALTRKKRKRISLSYPPPSNSLPSFFINTDSGCVCHNPVDIRNFSAIKGKQNFFAFFF
jgi:hypothetical protein